MITVTQRPKTPDSSLNVLNGSMTTSLSPWYNIGSGTAWVLNAGKARCTITSGDSRRLRQPFLAKNGVTYNYSFEMIVSSSGAFSFLMSFRKKDGSTGQTIKSQAPANGTNVYSGTVVANADYDYVQFSITENIP